MAYTEIECSGNHLPREVGTRKLLAKFNENGDKDKNVLFQNRQITIIVLGYSESCLSYRKFHVLLVIITCLMLISNIAQNCSLTIK